MSAALKNRSASANDEPPNLNTRIPYSRVSILNYLVITARHTQICELKIVKKKPAALMSCGLIVNLCAYQPALTPKMLMVIIVRVVPLKLNTFFIYL